MYVCVTSFSRCIGLGERDEAYGVDDGVGDNVGGGEGDNVTGMSLSISAKIVDFSGKAKNVPVAKHEIYFNLCLALGY